MGGDLIAFDIGTAQLKLVWYAGAARKKAVCVTMPEKLVENGEIISMDAMADFIRETARENGIPRKGAAIVLPASLVFTRNIDVPAMTDAQLCYNLPFEFKDYLRQEKSHYYFDYAVNEVIEDDDGKPRSMRLFACATLKKTIEDYREMLRRAGFKLKTAIPEEAAYAALMAAKKPQGDEDPSDTCFVDLGYNAIRMQIFRGQEFITRRTIDIGICDIVRALGEARGVDEHMAYEHFRSDYEGALNDPISLDFYHRMAVEIMKAINFYNYNNREQTLRRIYLCGGGAAVDTLRRIIAEQTNTELIPAGELWSEGAAPEEPYLYLKATGCALQG